MKPVIDDQLVDHIAHLSRLHFEGDEKVSIKKDLEKMLDFVDALNEVDTSNVQPLIYLSEEINVLREDDVSHEVSKKEALKNAPDKDSDYFRVPKVLERSED